MQNNPIPDSERPMLALAEDCADGCAAIQDAVNLKQTRETDLRGLITALKGDAVATPPTPGLIYLFKQRDMEEKAAKTARKGADENVKAFMTEAREALLPVLGRNASPEWTLAGFGDGAANSNAVPGTQDGRLQGVSSLAIYLAQHPTYQVPAGGVRPEVTAARAQALHTALSDARQAANDAGTIQGAALNAKQAGFAALRRRLVAFVDELALLLSDDDPRWETFGLNIPSNPRAPDAAENLVLSGAGPGRVLAEWDRGTRSNNHRILIQIIGTDPEYREYGKSGGDTEHVLKNLPSGATVKIKIIALNGDLEADSGPEGQIGVE